MLVYVVKSDSGILSICKSRQVADWEKEKFNLYGEEKNVKITLVDVIEYDEEFHKKELEHIYNDLRDREAEHERMCDEVLKHELG